MEQSQWAPKPTPAVVEEKARAVRPIDASLDEPTTNSLRPASPAPPTPSALSAAATTFSPAPAVPPPDASTDEVFTQTGAHQDDLFDDVVPVDGSMRVRSEADLFSDDFVPAERPIVEQHRPSRGRGRGGGDGSRGRGGRGRGRGARGGAGGPYPSARPPQQPQQQQKQQQQQESGETEVEAVAGARPSPPDNAPAAPRKETVAAVRGDRQATGGVRKPKLTEDQLAEKMARIQIKNASLTAAHARAEADAASFAEREEKAKMVAAQRQREERRDRQQMMGEREQNRMRKLKAMEGREWDAEKSEEDFRKGGRNDKKGGFAGDKEDYNDGREYLYREPRGGGRGRGGGGNARGGTAREQTVPRAEDFPALPMASKSAAGGVASKPSLDAPTTAGASWADQVE